jgi:hypothetical protein
MHPACAGCAQRAPLVRTVQAIPKHDDAWHAHSPQPERTALCHSALPGRMSMNISLSDVLIHIDEALSQDRRQAVEAKLRDIDGVVSVKIPDERPHLTLVEYLHEKVDSQRLLAAVTGEGVHAELVGL